MLHKLVEDLSYIVEPSLKNKAVKTLGRVMYNFKKNPNHSKAKLIWDKYNNMPKTEVSLLKKKVLSDMTGIPSSKIWEYTEHDFACSRGMFWITTEYEILKDIEDGELTGNEKAWKIGDFLIYHTEG